MITEYKPGIKKDLVKPLTVSSAYDSANGGVSIDFYYGPYGTPEHGLNFFNQLSGLTMNQYPIPFGEGDNSYSRSEIIAGIDPDKCEFVRCSVKIKDGVTLYEEDGVTEITSTNMDRTDIISGEIYKYVDNVKVKAVAGVDYMYATLPKNGVYYYSIDGDDFSRVVANSETILTSPDHCYMIVYKAPLDYEKQLAKTYLTVAQQMLPGKKVSFIDEFGKPIEYTVVETRNGQVTAMDFIETEVVNNFTINFLYLGDLDGSTSTQLQVKHNGVGYTLPKCQLTPPTFTMNRSMVPDPTQPNVSLPQIFAGWTPDPLYDGETEDHDELYAVNDLINLNKYYQTDNNYNEKFVNLYAVFIIPEKIDVDFQNGYYVTSGNTTTFHSIDIDESEPDFTGLIKMPQGVEPENYENERFSYFMLDDSWNADWMWVGEISWQNVLQIAAQKNINIDNYLVDHDTQSTSETIGKYDYRNVLDSSGPLGIDTDKKAFNIPIGVDSNDYWFFYLPAQANAENPKDITTGQVIPWANLSENSKNLIKHARLTGRRWCVRIANQARLSFYPNMDAVFNPQHTYYRQVVVDSISNYVNGDYCNTFYDTTCVSYAPSFSGATVQLTSNLYPDYESRFEFDKWEVYAFDNNFPTYSQYSQLNPTSSNHVKDLNQQIATLVLDSKRTTQGQTDKYRDKYLMRAVYKEKNIFAYVNLKANNALKFGGTEFYHMGWIDIYRVTADGDSRQVAKLGNNVYGQGGYNDITLDANYNDCISLVTIEGTQYLKVNTVVAPSLTFVAQPFNKKANGSPVGEDEPEYVNFLKWKGAIESPNTNVTLALEPGHTYNLKAWFLRNDDSNAYVVIQKGFTYPNFMNNSYNGSKAQIYDIAYEQSYINAVSGVVTFGLVNTVAGQRTYMADLVDDYLPYAAKHTTSTSKSRQISEMAMMSAYLGGNANTTIGSVQLKRAETPVNGNTLKVDVSEGTNYCYVVAAVKLNSANTVVGLPFEGWDDTLNLNIDDEGLTTGKMVDGYIEYERLVSVDVPGTFIYKAVFNNSPSGGGDVIDTAFNDDEFGGNSGNGGSTGGSGSKTNWGFGGNNLNLRNNVFDGETAYTTAALNGPSLLGVEVPVTNSTTGEYVMVTNTVTGVKTNQMTTENHFTYNPQQVANTIATSTGAALSGAYTETVVDEGNNTASQTQTTLTLKGATVTHNTPNGGALPAAPVNF